MFDFFNAKHKAEGLSPGTLVYTGAPRAEEARIRVHRLGSGTPQVLAFDRKNLPALDDTPIWLDVEGLHDLEAIRTVGLHFGLHDLILEDIVNPIQRPKAEVYEDQLFMVFQDSYFEDSELHASQVTLVLGPKLLLSFHPYGTDPFLSICERLTRGGGRLATLGLDYLAYTLMDALVDRTFKVIVEMENELEDLEETLIDTPSPDETLQRSIDRQKKNLINLRRIILPLREVMLVLTQPESTFFVQGTRVFLRDVGDHVHQQIEFLEVARERIKDLSEVYHTQIGRQTNKIALALTLLGGMFIPITFVASVFGMNFQRMPGLEAPNGFMITMGGMFLLALIMFLYFRFKKWF